MKTPGQMEGRTDSISYIRPFRLMPGVKKKKKKGKKEKLLHMTLDAPQYL